MNQIVNFQTYEVERFEQMTILLVEKKYVEGEIYTTGRANGQTKWKEHERTTSS